MLVLSRHANEDVILRVADVEITVRIVRIGNATVRLGITAPEEVSIVRKEIDADIPAAEGIPDALLADHTARRFEQVH